MAGPATQYPTWTSQPPGTTSAPLSTVLVIPSTPPSHSMCSVSPHQLYQRIIIKSTLSSHFIFNVGTHSQTFTNKIKTVNSIFETKTYYLFILNTNQPRRSWRFLRSELISLCWQIHPRSGVRRTNSRPAEAFLLFLAASSTENPRLLLTGSGQTSLPSGELRGTLAT